MLPTIVMIIIGLSTLAATYFASVHISERTRGDIGDASLGAFLAEVVNVVILALSNYWLGQIFGLTELPGMNWFLVIMFVLVAVVYFLTWLSVGLFRAAGNAS